jgi:hypothetical protein
MLIRLRQAAMVTTLSLICAAPALSQSSPQPAPAPPDSGWKTTVYPIYAFVPVFGADVTLPEVCDDCGGEPILPSGSVSSNFNGAAFFAVRVEKSRVSVDADFLWAGLSAEAARPLLDVKVTTVLGGARAGFRVAPDLFVEGGARRFALDVKVKFLIFDEVQWKPGLWEPVVGVSYNPQLTRTLKLYTHADYGGLGSDGHSTVAATGRIEWRPAKHFSLTGGYGFLNITADGTLLGEPIRLDQTLHGPIVGLGIPF